MKITNYFMTACFLFSVIVQYNDPDPLVWMLIYGAAAAGCVLFARGKYVWSLFAALSLITFIRAAMLAPQVMGRVAFSELFEAFEMKDDRVEVAREMGGLLIVAGWMLLLTIVSWRKTRMRTQPQ